MKRERLKAILMVVFMLGMTLVGTTPMFMGYGTDGGGGLPYYYIKTKTTRYAGASVIYDCDANGNYLGFQGEVSSNTQGYTRFYCFEEPGSFLTEANYDFTVPAKRYVRIEAWVYPSIESSKSEGPLFGVTKNWYKVTLSFKSSDNGGATWDNPTAVCVVYYEVGNYDEYGCWTGTRYQILRLGADSEWDAYPGTLYRIIVTASGGHHGPDGTVHQVNYQYNDAYLRTLVQIKAFYENPPH
jgi:hypothetical protein